LDAFQGNKEAAIVAMQEAGQAAVEAQGLQDGAIFSRPGLQVLVNGIRVALGGIVRNGVFTLGTGSPL